MTRSYWMAVEDSGSNNAGKDEPRKPDPPKSSADRRRSEKEDRPPLAQAVVWVARMSSIVSEMVLPALIGHYFDGKWGTGYLGLIGLVIGVSVGMWHLFQVSREFK